MQLGSSAPASYPTSPVRSWRTRLPFFYGWVVVGSAFMSLAIALGVYYSFSVFFVALLEEYHWSRGATAMAFSIFVLVSALGGVFSGAIVDRFGPNRVFSVGGVLMAVGLAAASRITDLWQYYLFYGVVAGFGFSFSSWVPSVTVISRWFSGKRGTALGIGSAGIGLGTVLMVPFSQYLISAFGWRSAYLILAGVALVGIGPQAALLQVGRPEELGLRPDGGSDTTTAAAQRRASTVTKLVVVDQKWASYPWSISSAVRTARFWFLVGNFGFSLVTNQMLWAHQAAYLVDGGYDKMLAASVVGLAGFLSMFGKVFWGAVSDRLGRELTFTMGVSIMVVAIGLLVLTRFVPGVWLVLAFAVIFSVGYAVTAPLSPTAAGDVFGGARFGSIYGLLHVGTGMGSAFGAWLAGYVFDVTGSYFAAFGVGAACSITSIACIWLAAPRKVRRVVRSGQ